MICPIYKTDVEDEYHCSNLYPAYKEKKSSLFEPLGGGAQPLSCYFELPLV